MVVLVGLTARTDTVDQVGVEALAPGRTSPASPSLPCLEHRGGCRGEERFMILILVIIDTTTMAGEGAACWWTDRDPSTAAARDRA